jgi:lysozyme
MDLIRMEQQLVLHEGERLTAYMDTLENWTIFVGYNLSARGVDALEHICKRPFRGPYESLSGTQDESRAVLKEDIIRLDKVIPVAWPYYAKLDGIRQRVALDMAFNMGLHALSFKNTIAAVERKDYSAAVRNLYQSKWAGQVGHGRSQRLGQMLLTGQDFTS